MYSQLGSVLFLLHEPGFDYVHLCVHVCQCAGMCRCAYMCVHMLMKTQALFTLSGVFYFLRQDLSH